VGQEICRKTKRFQYTRMKAVTRWNVEAVDSAQVFARLLIIWGNAVLSNAPLLSLHLPSAVEWG